MTIVELSRSKIRKYWFTRFSPPVLTGTHRNVQELTKVSYVCKSPKVGPRLRLHVCICPISESGVFWPRIVRCGGKLLKVKACVLELTPVVSHVRGIGSCSRASLRPSTSCSPTKTDSYSSQRATRERRTGDSVVTPSIRGEPRNASKKAPMLKFQG